MLHSSLYPAESQDPLRDLVSQPPWEQLWISQEELEEAAGDREVWWSVLLLLLNEPDGLKSLEDEWMDTCFQCCLDLNDLKVHHHSVRTSFLYRSFLPLLKQL